MPRMKFAFALYIALFLAFFQALMPIIGYFAGTIIEEEITSIDHWLAFILLSFIGAKMVYEGMQSDEYVEIKRDYQLSLKSLISQSIATSIDALAVGITFAFLQTKIWFAAFIIGAITFVISMIGLRMGKSMGMKLRGKLEIIGGIFLFGIGLKILLQHLFFS
jgi:putative Mn2+ efflux pump MntP